MAIEVMGQMDHMEFVTKDEEEKATGKTGVAT